MPFKNITIPLIEDLVRVFGENVIESLKANSTIIQQPHPGSVWISSLDGKWGSWNGKVVSCYYHPHKSHSATTIGKLGTKKSVAPPGKWAISYQTRAMFGNKTFYNTN